MATIKSYTSLEQSRKLAEFLPLESADMVIWGSDLASVAATDAQKFMRGLKERKMNYLPCWSLAALLNYLKSKNKFPEIKELSDGRFKLTTYIWDGEDCIQVSIGDTIVDACCEMILKLHELKML